MIVSVTTLICDLQSYCKRVTSDHPSNDVYALARSPSSITDRLIKKVVNLFKSSLIQICQDLSCLYG